MSYSLNPNLPRVRMEAVKLIRQGWSTREVARHFGYDQSAVVRWCGRAPTDSRAQVIPTRSSRPHHHPHELSSELIRKIVAQRLKRGRCAEVVHADLVRQGIVVNLSSVKRTLEREGLLKKRSPWKRYHAPVERPQVASVGDLVQVDTIHFVPLRGIRFYAYTLLDVYSKWAYAKITSRINTHYSLLFTEEAQSLSPFAFNMLQSDHGSEFSTWFTENAGIDHRHSRVRKCNDNAHIERFNRTIQEECFRGLREDPLVYQQALDEYLPYYNTERLHLGLNLKTPLEVMPSY